MRDKEYGVREKNMWWLYQVLVSLAFFLVAFLSAIFMYIRFSQNRYITGKEIPADKKAQVKQRYILFPLLMLGFSIYMGFFWKAPEENVTYTFENKSSFAVTIYPEFGDDFQIQSGAIKSFESSRKDMAISYTPSDYVEVEKINTRHWEFLDGNYYFEANRGFLINPPESWEVINWPGLKYKAIIGQVDINFAPNINFVEIDNPFSQFYTYISVITNQLQENCKVIEGSQFDTDSGLKGYKIKTNTEKLLQIYYVFDLTQTAFTVTCSAPLQSETDYNQVFDDSVRTLEFIY